MSTSNRQADKAAPGAVRTRPDDETITVVIPTRNRAALLGRALASVRTQSYRPLEIIVIDDASTDGTAALLEEWAADERRLRSVRTDTAVGPARARNLGIEAARGSLVAFLDDDDEWLPGKLELQCATLTRSDAGLVYCPYIHVIDGVEHIGGAVDASGGDALRLLTRGNFIATPGVVVRTGLLRELGGFDERMPMLEDWDLWLRLAVRTRFSFVPTPLFRVYVSAGSMTSRVEARREACARIAVRVPELRPGDRRLHADTLYAVGHELMNGGAPDAGRSYLRRSLRVRPWPPQRWLITMAAHLGATPYALATGLHRWALDRVQLRRLARGSGTEMLA